MNKAIIRYVLTGLTIFALVAPTRSADAQSLNFPAEINKRFSPISISPGGVSRLSVTIYNPNSFALTSASWSDNLVGVQPGMVIATPPNISNSCGGSVTAVAGQTTFSLSGGTVPAQVGITPGSCTVSIDVTASASGNFINTIPAGALSSTGGGTNITNTTPASATLNVVSVPAPTISKAFSPSTIWVGEVSQLTLSIRNNDLNTTLTHASLTDTLPANVFLANPVSPVLTGCGASPSLTANSGGTTIAFSNGTIAPNSRCTITVSVTSNIQGAYINTIPPQSLQNDQNLTNASQATARLNVDAIGITKAFSPSTIPAGGTTTLTITLLNPTNSPYTGVNVSDTLPGTILTMVAGSAATTCGGTVSITQPRTVSLTGGTIPAGTPTTPGTCTITVQVTAPAGTASSSFSNVIPAGALTTNQGVGNPRSATATLRVAGSDVVGTKSFSPSSIPVGGNSRLRIDIFAPGDTNLTNFSVTDNLPSGITVSNSTAPAVSGCGAAPPRVLTAPTGATSISLTNGLVLAGQRCRIDVYVTGSTAGTYANSIPPSNITNTENRAPQTALTANLNVTTASPASLAIDVVKGFDPLTVFGGSSSTMSVQLLNPEAVTLTGIAFTDNMPTGMILANPLNFNVGTCGGSLTGTPGANAFSFSGGSLPPGSTCTLTLSATMTVNGNLTNTIPTGAVTSANGASNPDPAAASLTNLPGASVSKFFSPNPIPVNSYSLLTITIQNTGNIPLSGMGLDDNLPGTLPAGLVVAGSSAPAPINNCGGTLSAVAGSQFIQLTNGSLGATTSCTIIVAVTGSTAGSYDNIIPTGALKSAQRATNNQPARDTLRVEGPPPPPPSDPGDPGRGVRGGSRQGSATTASGNFFILIAGGFAPGRETELSTLARPSYSPTSLILEIPVIKVNAPIVGVGSKNGKWDVSWLHDQAGWLEGTAYPTLSGNSVLTGHVTNADGKPGPFSKLKYLKAGEYIFVHNSGFRYIYKVVSNEIVGPQDNRGLKHEDKSFLTLVTCDRYDLKSNTYLRRIVVSAKLVSVEAEK